MGLIFFAFFEKFFVPILTSGGYVGLSIATLLSQHHKVTAVDIVPEKVELINNKKSPIQDEYIEKYLAEKELDLTATLDAKEAYSDADFVVIAAPTNYDSKKNFFDTSAVEAVIKLVIEYNPLMVEFSVYNIDYIRSQTSKYLKGDWDLTGGFSGGPLVEYISGAGYVAIGIHKDGSTIDGSSYPTSYPAKSEAE